MRLARIVAAAVLATAGVARAQEHTHDGFFLQFDLGGGYLRSKIDDTVLNAKLDGGGGEFAVAVGYNFAPGLILAGQLWGIGVADPSLELNGQRVNTDDTTLALSGVGVALTYYLKPYNVYFQATPSVTTLRAERDGADIGTNTGFGVRLAVGKEWWVSDSWGLGLNVQAAWSSNDLDVGGGAFGSQWYGLALSATYD
jgi:hypothetical protein